MTQHRPDVIALQETYWSPIHKPYFPNYITYRLDRTTHGGGVALLIRKECKCAQLPIPKLSPFEAVSAKIWWHGQEDRVITVTSLYVPRYNNTFSRHVHSLFNCPEHIVMGDWNARHQEWNNSQTNCFWQPKSLQEYGSIIRM